jgi:hypothetical protein
MASGSILLKRASFFSLAALTLLTGCLQFEPGNVVSWSPSGGRLAFISAGKAWVYDLETGRMGALPSRREPSGVSWSPREGLIATSTAGLVETYVEGPERVFSSSAAYVMPFLGSDALSVLAWHPTQLKVLDAAIGSRAAETTEIDLGARRTVRLGPGVGVYGPAGRWLLWAAQTSIGMRDEKIIFDRQSPQGESLPLDVEAVHVLEAGFLDSMTTAQDQASPEPVCARREDGRRGRVDFYCFDAQGELRRRASLPVTGHIFPDQRRRLFAVLEEKNDEYPTLAIYDRDGRRRADAKKFLAAARAGSGDRSLRVSRLAWSPDGNWLAWIVDGRLCLWNWRNDVVRVHAPPPA